ncbi:hypothetical protein LCGC14_1269290 [marine sediment metagenome]|uniref:HNH nuclease domain-containing protein n=1 Tax=marine sediment metagenome TaxID=412755 RepID=A0A0F9NFC1_9ZZZZ|nr:hypothetical protein [bacterium]
MEKEVWKKINGYEDLYMISNLGRIKSFWKDDKILKGGIDGNGYRNITLRKNGNGKTAAVHRLVATYFVKGFKRGLEVNHKDGDKTNNHVDNLEWCTRRENIKHALKMGLLSDKRGAKNGNSKLSETVVSRIRLMKEIEPKLTAKRIARMFNVTQVCIYAVLSRRSWRHVT